MVCCASRYCMPFCHSAKCAFSSVKAGAFPLISVIVAMIIFNMGPVCVFRLIYKSLSRWYSNPYLFIVCSTSLFSIRIAFSTVFGAAFALNM